MDPINTADMLEPNYPGTQNWRRTGVTSERWARAVFANATNRQSLGALGLGQEPDTATSASLKKEAIRLVGLLTAQWHTAERSWAKLLEMAGNPSASVLFSTIKGRAASPVYTWSNPLLVQAKKVAGNFQRAISDTQKWLSMYGTTVDKVAPEEIDLLGKRVDEGVVRMNGLRDALLQSPFTVFASTLTSTFWSRSKALANGIAEFAEATGKAGLSIAKAAGDLPGWLLLAGAAVILMPMLPKLLK